MDRNRLLAGFRGSLYTSLLQLRQAANSYECDVLTIAVRLSAAVSIAQSQQISADSRTRASSAQPESGETWRKPLPCLLVFSSVSMHISFKPAPFTHPQQYYYLSCRGNTLTGS